MAAVANSMIVLDERGRAWIEGANTKVVQVVKDLIAHGWSPEEIHYQLPHLSLAQIHAALSYYYAHKPEFDNQIKIDQQEVDRIRREQGESPFAKRITVLPLGGKSS
jgi:uncharacterized protein (DUF433 family)